MTQVAWRNRIVGYSEEPPGKLTPSPLNWRKHPKNQADALDGVLREVGVVQNIIVNRTTGRMIDGHLRVELALRDKQPTVPVTWVELTEAEEATILATLDPLAAMAQADATALDALLASVNSGDVAVQAMLAELAEDAGIVHPGVEMNAGIDNVPEQWAIMIECFNEEEQIVLLERLTDEGLKCRALIS